MIFEPLLSRRSQVANIFPMDGWVQKSYGTIESCFQGIFGLGLVDGGCIPEGIESGGGVREQQASVPGLNASTSKLYSTDCSAAAKVLCKLSYLIAKVNSADFKRLVPLKLLGTISFLMQVLCIAVYIGVCYFHISSQHG